MSRTIPNARRKTREGHGIALGRPAVIDCGDVSANQQANEACSGGRIGARKGDDGNVARNQWTAPSGAGSLRQTIDSAVSLEWLVQTGLCLSFLTAFLQYEITSGFIVFCPSGGPRLVAACWSCADGERTDRLQHILSGGGLWFAASAVRRGGFLYLARHIF